MVLQQLRKTQQTPTLYKPRDLKQKDFAEPVPSQLVHQNIHYVNNVSDKRPRRIQMHPLQTPEEVGVGTPGAAAAIGAAKGKHPTGAMAEAEAFHASALATITLWLQGTPPLDAAQTQTTSRRPNRARKGTSTTWSTWTTRRTPCTQTGPPQRSTG